MIWELIKIDKTEIPSDMRMGKKAVGFIATVSDGRSEYKAFGMTKDRATDRAFDHVNGNFNTRIIKRNILLSKEEMRLINRIKEGDVVSLELRTLCRVTPQKLANMIKNLQSRGVPIKSIGRVKMNQRSYSVYSIER